MSRTLHGGIRAAFSALLAATWIAAGCGDSKPTPPDPGPTLSRPVEDGATAPRYGRAAHARKEMAESLQEDLEAARHPSDGGGRGWLESATPERVQAAGIGTWTIVYEAGAEGIAVGGTLFFQVSPFWYWSTPQPVEEQAPGYTTVETAAEGVELDVRTLDRQLLGITIGGRALAAGERVRIVYGAGPAGARADRFAERESRFFLGVDGDGDGVRAWLDDSPAVDVHAAPPAGLLLHLPATARPGEEVGLVVAVVDGQGSAGTAFEGEIVFGGGSDAVHVPTKIALDAAARGLARVPVRVDGEGIVRIRATGPGDLLGLSNPMRVSEDGPRIRFGDLHGHSNLSDGTGTPEDYHAYARDVAGLDFVVLTDHDHWGIPFLDASPERRKRIADAAEAANDPGHFVTLHGYEWTSWIFGHRHVVYFEPGGPWLSSLSPDYDTPEQLWAGLRGRSVLTFAHHSAGGPIATDWSIPPDPELEPLTEIASVHGSSEAPDSPSPIYDPVPGNYVRDALDLGYRLGFVGSGDSHDGHPGLAHLASGQGGVAAVFSEDLTREGLHRALADRLTYATNGPRILLDVRLAGNMMGRVLSAEALGPEAQLVADVVGTGEIERVDLVRSGEVVATLDAEGRSDLLLGYPVRGLEPGEYLYVRVVQRDGGAAWSSPFFIE